MLFVSTTRALVENLGKWDSEHVTNATNIKDTDKLDVSNKPSYKPPSSFASMTYAYIIAILCTISPPMKLSRFA